MAQQLFKNNAGGVMSGTLAIGGTTLNMAAGQGARFPAPAAGEYFLLTLYEKDVGAVEFNYEVVKVTARVADSMTIERDFEGMVVAAGGTSGGWAYPSAPGLNPSQVVYVDLRYTAYGAMNTLTKDDNLASVANAATARSNIGAEEAAKKNATGGYPGLSGFALQLKNAADTFTNLLTNATTAIRTWTLPDYDGTLSTLAGTETLTNKTLVAPALGTPASGDATNLTNTVAPQTHAATSKATPVDADEFGGTDSAASFGLVKFTWANIKATLLSTLKDATGGLVGLTLFKINFRNAANTFTSFLTNANTAARTYTFPDKNITVAGLDDITGGTVAASFTDLTTTGNTVLGNATTDTVNIGAGGIIKDASGNTGFGGNGTFAGPTILVNTNKGLIQHDGTAYYVRAQTGPMYLGANSTNTVVLDAAGNMLLVTPGGLGYGTGAGGTATQATSKSTAVTLNKPTGNVTTHNAALAAGASITFTINNSLVALSDTVSLSFLATLAGVQSNYSMTHSVGTQSIVVTLKNESAGSLSEPVPINFILGKGSFT